MALAGQGNSGAGLKTTLADPRAFYEAAEAQTYRLTGDGVKSFSCRVRSPWLEKLSEPGGLLGGREIRLTLWWEAPNKSRVTMAGAAGMLGEVEREQLIGLFAPLHELVVPIPPSKRLASHRFREVPEAAVEGATTVVEAGALSLDDPRRTARFTIDGRGLVVREQTERADGGYSDLHFQHVNEAGRWLLVECSGWHLGEEVSLSIDWTTEEGTRPLPVRVVARRFDAAGRTLVGAMGEMVFDLSEHELNPELPAWVFGSR